MATRGPRDTAFMEGEAEAIRSQIQWLAQRIASNFLLADVTVKDLAEVLLPEEMRRFAFDVSHHYGSVLSSSCFSATVYDVSKGFEARNWRLVLGWHGVDRLMSFAMPPSKAPAYDMTQSTNEELRVRLLELLEDLRRNAIQMGFVRAVFDKLNKRLPKDREQVRYLLPGVYTLLRGAGTRLDIPNLLDLASKLQTVRYSSRFQPVDQEVREQLVHANELIAAAQLYEEKTPPATTQIHVSLQFTGNVVEYNGLYFEPIVC